MKGSYIKSKELDISNLINVVQVNFNVEFINDMTLNIKKHIKEIYTISELAVQLDISPSTIRFYEEKKLIQPGRTPGNQRFYTKKNWVRLKLILRGKRFGYTLDEIAEVIGMYDTEMKELDQINRALASVVKKFKELRQRKYDISLIEHDLATVKEKLSARKKELKSDRMNDRSKTA